MKALQMERPLLNCSGHNSSVSNPNRAFETIKFKVPLPPGNNTRLTRDSPKNFSLGFTASGEHSSTIRENPSTNLAAKSVSIVKNPNGIFKIIIHLLIRTYYLNLFNQCLK